MHLHRRLFALAFLLAATRPSDAQDQLQFPAEIRQWFRNPDGSCVQCSIGMCGVWQNVPAATTLLWDTAEYGPRVRGGSGPSRVEQYCDQRKIAAWNITGGNTWDWMDWCAKTGRFAAIGAGAVHFQTLCWFDPAEKKWYVCNNNSPERFDAYTPDQFRRLHLASGQWVVILKAPPPPAYPVFVAWWDP